MDGLTSELGLEGIVSLSRKSAVHFAYQSLRRGHEKPRDVLVTYLGFLCTLKPPQASI